MRYCRNVDHSMRDVVRILKKDMYIVPNMNVQHVSRKADLRVKSIIAEIILVLTRKNPVQNIVTNIPVRFVIRSGRVNNINVHNAIVLLNNRIISAIIMQ